MDDYFISQPVGGLSAVVSNEIILTRCPNVPEAIRTAVQVASGTASEGRTVQVLVDEPGRGHTVIWDSNRDGFSKGRGPAVPRQGRITMTQDTRGQRIPLVEDEAMIAMLVEDMLEDISHELITVATRLEEALTAARN